MSNYISSQCTANQSAFFYPFFPWLSRRWHHGGGTIWHPRRPGCWLLVAQLEAVGEALCLDGVGSATGVDARTTLDHGVVDLSGLQPDLAGNKRVVRVTICAVIASHVKAADDVLK